jgi:hypothetical protein
VPETGLIATNNDSVDLDRYERYRGGETIQKIAVADHVQEPTARASIRAGEVIAERALMRKLGDKKLKGALKNEEIREEVRDKLGVKFLASLEKLLDGTRVVVQRNKDTGQITMHEIADPEIMAQGVEQFRKVTSLEEKPAAQTVVNVQQNNTQLSGERIDFESLLARVKGWDRPVVQQGVVIDAEVVEEKKVEQQGADQWNF